MQVVCSVKNKVIEVYKFVSRGPLVRRKGIRRLSHSSRQSHSHSLVFPTLSPSKIQINPQKSVFSSAHIACDVHYIMDMVLEIFGLV